MAVYAAITVLGLSLLCVSAEVLAASPCERLVATADAQSPPYLWHDPQRPKHLIGAYADLLAQLGPSLGVRIKLLDSGSWAQAQQEVQSGRVDLLLGALLESPARAQFDYVQPAAWPAPVLRLGDESLAALVPAAQLDIAPVIGENYPQYLALARDSVCNEPWLRGQLAKKMAELRASGLLESLLQRNLARWQAQQLAPPPVLDAPNQ